MVYWSMEVVHLLTVNFNILFLLRHSVAHFAVEEFGCVIA